MARITVVFGVLLVVLGLFGFFTTGATHKTALIPTYFGAALILCGVLANTPDEKRRMLWMHIAVTLGLVGFVIPLFRLIPHWSTMAAAARNSQLAMVAICFVFTALCVRSFITARRNRA